MGHMTCPLSRIIMAIEGAKKAAAQSLYNKK